MAAQETILLGAANDVSVFGNSTGLTTDQLSQITFYSNSGSTLLGSAGYTIGMDGEIAPVCEPGTWLAAVLGLGGLGFTQRRRLGRFRFLRRLL